MAVIGKIRKQSGLLIGVIGGAMVLFVLGDVLGSGSSIFSSGPNNEIGEINGQKISYAQFDQKVSNTIATQYGGKSLNEQEAQQVREQVWDDIVRDVAIKPEFEKLGITVSDDEFIYELKNNPFNPVVRSYFSNRQTGEVIPQFASPTGGVNGQAVINYFNQVLQADAQTDPNVLQAKQSWEMFKIQLINSMLDAKYNTVLAKGLYATNVEAEEEFKSKSNRVSFSYVAKYYTSVSDSSLKVSDADLKAFYNEHKNEGIYKQTEPMRGIEFVTFQVKPTDSDIENASMELKDMMGSFEVSTDDTLFVLENGDTPNNSKWVVNGSLPSAYDSLVMTADLGKVVGPFRNADKFEIIKIKDKKIAPDSTKASHILIPIAESDSAAAWATVDSVMQEIKKQNDFAAVARLTSADQGSAEKGGDLGWFTENIGFVPEFKKACFANKVGEINTVVSQFGIHILKIDERTKPVEKVLVAIVDNDIEASDATFEDIYSKASQFAIANKSVDQFEEEGKKYNFQTAPSIRKNDAAIQGVNDTRKIVRWAFNAEVGEVSEVFTLNDRYIVALVSESREEGVLPFELVKDMIRPMVINEKKGVQIAKEMTGETNMSTLASKVNGSVQNVQDLHFDDFSIPGLGIEQDLQGIVFTMESGQVSVPIKGSRGVYVVKIDAVNNMDPSGLESFKNQLNDAVVQRVRYEPINAMKDVIDIKDNRASFY